MVLYHDEYNPRNELVLDLQEFVLGWVGPEANLDDITILAM